MSYMSEEPVKLYDDTVDASGGVQEIFSLPLDCTFSNSVQIEWTGTLVADAFQVQTTLSPRATEFPDDAKWVTRPEVVFPELAAGTDGFTNEVFGNNAFDAFRVRCNFTTGTGTLVIRGK